MAADLTYRQIFNYYRMALVTGLLEKEAIVAWADTEIMASPLPDTRVIELSLCGKRSYSWIIWRLREMQERPDHDLPLKLLLARAGVVFEREPERCIDVILGLRLLNEEQYLPADVREAISGLRVDLEAHLQGVMSAAELAGNLAVYLDRYSAFRHLQDAIS